MSNMLELGREGQKTCWLGNLGPPGRLWGRNTELFGILLAGRLLRSNTQWWRIEVATDCLNAVRRLRLYSGAAPSVQDPWAGVCRQVSESFGASAVEFRKTKAHRPFVEVVAAGDAADFGGNAAADFLAGRAIDIIFRQDLAARGTVAQATRANASALRMVLGRLLARTMAGVRLDLLVL